ncbi:hypothetical protein BDM02DRAFT_3262363 [Thelephora ganbajun]|uniref:Uncharacterized protein n=1 Tax=Thelephora ganbajun TaxID=370292 RepID=A0ACB6Z9V1_THEGA|nr:hypothetical protein BDM02DRAFT_3262363 [Thelephora ganbajun]
MTVTLSIYDAGWLPYRITSYVVGKPLRWALQQTDVVESGGVESGAQSLNQRAKETGVFAGKLCTVGYFKGELSGVALPDVVLSDLDMKVSLKHLERNMKVAVKGRVVIQSHLQPSRTNLEFHRLSSLLARILNLGQSILLTAAGRAQGCRADPEYPNRVDTKPDKEWGGCTLTQKTSSTLKQNRKEIALGYLRARKQLEGILVKRSKVLENLESTPWTVEHAAGDVEVIPPLPDSPDIQVLSSCSQIMKFYESSVATLRTVFSHLSLQRDKIYETTEALHSATEDAKNSDLTIHLADWGESRTLAKDVKDEKHAAEKWGALEELKRLEEKLEGMKTPLSVPGVLGEPERAGPVKEGAHAQKTSAFPNTLSPMRPGGGRPCTPV